MDEKQKVQSAGTEPTTSWGLMEDKRVNEKHKIQSAGTEPTTTWGFMEDKEVDSKLMCTPLGEAFRISARIVREVPDDKFMERINNSILSESSNIRKAYGSPFPQESEATCKVWEVRPDDHPSGEAPLDPIDNYTVWALRQDERARVHSQSKASKQTFSTALARILGGKGTNKLHPAGTDFVVGNCNPGARLLLTAVPTQQAGDSAHLPNKAFTCFIKNRLLEPLGPEF